MQSNAAQIRGSKRKRACFSTLHGVGTIEQRALSISGLKLAFRKAIFAVLTQAC
jgi:hypothetical protein